MKKRINITIGLLLIAIFLFVLRLFPDACEWWTLNIVNNYLLFVGSLSNNIPFTLFEITTLLIFGFLVYLLIRFIISITKKNKEQRNKRFFSLVSYILGLLVFFMTISGLSYERHPVPIKLYEDQITDTLVDETIEYYLEDYNQLSEELAKNEKGVTIFPGDFNEIALLVRDECAKLDDSYFLSYNPIPKKTFLSPLLSEFNIVGIEYSFTAEAIINGDIPFIDIPFSIAHEIAHIKGVMRENEANLTALYVCINSSNPYIRYSGYFRGFARLLEIKALTNRTEYLDIISRMNRNIFIDNNDYITYFEEHGFLKDVSDFFNNIYLMFNGQSEGVDSYDDPSSVIDTGKVDDDGNKIYEYKNYSNYQKLLIQHFVESKIE